jgi:hypothetical protein
LPVTSTVSSSRTPAPPLSDARDMVLPRLRSRASARAPAASNNSSRSRMLLSLASLFRSRGPHSAAPASPPGRLQARRARGGAAAPSIRARGQEGRCLRSWASSRKGSFD